MSWRSVQAFGARMILLATVVVGPIATTTPLHATPQADDARRAKQCVDEALHREIYGQDDQRTALLQRAKALSSRCRAAHWQTGHVLMNHDWIRAEDLPRLTAGDRRLIRYRQFRDKAPETVAGQWALANWCAAEGLHQQERAHLTQLLQLEPDHAQARRRLGFVRVDGAWLSREEVVESRRRAAAAAEAFAEWRPKLQDLRRSLLTGGQKQREYAEGQLQAITDPAAIPALEAVFSAHSELLAQRAIELLIQIGGSEASVSLARHAVFSGSEAIRESAAKALRDREMDQFVPVLLSAMQLSIQTQREVVQGPRGRLLYRHAFYREGGQANELTLLETSYRRIAMPGGNRQQTLGRAVDDIRDRATSREATVDAANQRTGDLNRRVMGALATATRLDLFNSPKQWWQWWNDVNEVYVPDDKELKTTLREEEVNLVDAVPLVSGPGGDPAVSGPGAGGDISGGGYDCLAAGSLIWTDSGTKPIEKVQVGDLVLSQDPETGRLSYQPVVGTTIRPASPLVQIESVDGETLSTSGGHLFWVPGDGWVRARHVKPGHRLHGVDGAVTVSQVGEITPAETYNLIVADQHTYFVSQSRILCHDNTVHRPTQALVPGLVVD